MSDSSTERYDYDLVVIGSGPAGQKAAITAATLGRTVAVVDRTAMLGGVCVHTGTIPSKTLRAAILYLTGYKERLFYGQGYTLKDDISIRDLTARVQAVVDRETDVIRAQLRRSGVSTFGGLARFRDAHTVEVETGNGRMMLSAANFLIACGTRPAESPRIPMDGKRSFTADHIFQMDQIPRDLIVVGAGVIGMEYASMLTTLGTEVTVIDQQPVLLDFVDDELVEALAYHMRRRGATFRLGETVVSVETDSRDRVTAHLESGKTVHGEALLYTVGRQANADMLNLESVGIQPDARGRLVVNERFQTNVPNIYAAGDVIGFPALASTSLEQGRLASCHMFGVTCPAQSSAIPFGIYTIPEISMVGKTEEQLTREKVPYEVGVARYDELAKGLMLGDEIGLLKLLFCPNTLKLFGVHTIGQRASELVHIGQAVISYGGTVEYFRDTVFNYPTLAEAYKVAAMNGLSKL